MQIESLAAGSVIVRLRITVQDPEFPVDASTFAPVLSHLHNGSVLVVDQQNTTVEGNFCYYFFQRRKQRLCFDHVQYHRYSSQSRESKDMVYGRENHDVTIPPGVLSISPEGSEEGALTLPRYLQALLLLTVFNPSGALGFTIHFPPSPLCPQLEVSHILELNGRQDYCGVSVAFRYKHPLDSFVLQDWGTVFRPRFKNSNIFTLEAQPEEFPNVFIVNRTEETCMEFLLNQAFVWSSVITTFIFKGLSSVLRFPSWQRQQSSESCQSQQNGLFFSLGVLSLSEQEKLPLELQSIWTLRKTGQGEKKARDKLHLKPTDNTVAPETELQDADVCQNTL